MRQIVEWLPAVIPFMVIGMLCWYAHRQSKRAKLISRGKYEFIEDTRRLMGKPAIDWRGSMAKYNEDVDTIEALKFYRRRGGDINSPPAKADEPDSR